MGAGAEQKLKARAGDPMMPRFCPVRRAAAETRVTITLELGDSEGYAGVRARSIQHALLVRRGRGRDFDQWFRRIAKIWSIRCAVWVSDRSDAAAQTRRGVRRARPV